MVFQAHGADSSGTVVFRKTLRRAKVLDFFREQPRGRQPRVGINKRAYRSVSVNAIPSRWISCPATFAL
jgi:hypothetical protein